MYHREKGQEAFLVLAGECTLIVEEKERRLVAWDFFYCAPETEHIIVPWGVAHMPGIAKEIQKAGFRLEETKEYVVIRFRSAGDKSKSAGNEGAYGKPK